MDGDETQTLENGLFLSDLSLAVYFLLPKEKLLLSGHRVTKEGTKTTLGGVRHFGIKDQFTADLRRW